MTSLLRAFVFCCLFFSIEVKSQTVPAGDSLAMVDLYYSAGGANWSNHTNWLSANPISTWSGIRVRDGRIRTLNLPSNNVRGGLPPSIGNLDALDTLQMSNNRMTDSLPSSIGKLVNLLYFDLHYNRITGALPASIGNMRKVRLFYLLQNQMTGTIPETIGNLDSVRYLNIAVNDFTGGIPESIGQLKACTDLYLSDCKLTGSIPPVFGGMPNLASLNLRNNDLSGRIPADMGYSPKLRYLYLDRNDLHGEIPGSFRQLRTLVTIDVSHNKLTLSTNLDPFYPIRNLFAEVILENNAFTFNGLELFGNPKKFGTCLYTPQAKIRIHQHGNALAVSAGGTLSNNTYSWYQEGSLAPVVATGDSTFVPAESGRYWASVKNAIATALTLHTDTITYTATLPVTARTLPALQLSPNPAIAMLRISNLSAAGNANITITDMSGLVWVHTTARKQASLQVNVSRLKPGNYTLAVTEGSAVRKMQFIKE